MILTVRCRPTAGGWLRLASLAIAIGFAGSAAAQPAAAASAPASAVSAASFVQVMVGLVLVLMLVAGVAWLFRRIAVLPGAGAGIIRVVGAAAVGQRERIVVVEVDGTWLLVGVAPGAVRALHAMPKAQSAPAAAEWHAAEPRFAARLKQIFAGNRNA